MPSFANALITGASSGLGAAIALRLARRGTRVVLAARREHLLIEQRDAIAAEGGRAEVEVLDVADEEAAREAVLRWDRDLGGLDLVLANAGYGVARPAHKLEFEEMRITLQVNVMGAIATLHAAAAPMAERGRGTLVGMSSLAAMRGLPRSGTYAASKAALSSYLETAGFDLRRKGVRVVDIRPGFVKTAMTAQNRFQMPFLLELDDAADRCLRGIDRGKPVVGFPWPMFTLMRIASSMPDAVYRFAVRFLADRG